MENLINTKSNEFVITLKEITDLIEVRHDKAMAKIEKLSLEPSFGTVSKIDIVYNDKGQTTETYHLTKKQAIAAGAKLNNSLLMKVIDRLEELEKPKQLTPIQMIAQIAAHQANVEQQLQQNDIRLQTLENTSVIDSRDQRNVQNAVSVKVQDLLKKHHLSDANRSKLFASIYKQIKNTFNIPSYKDLPKVQLQNAYKLIESATVKVSA